MNNYYNAEKSMYSRQSEINMQLEQAMRVNQAKETGKSENFVQTEAGRAANGIFATMWAKMTRKPVSARI